MKRFSKSQLLAMASRAARTNKKVNGYTAKQLRAMALFAV
jgi:hypothetical protein